MHRNIQSVAISAAIVLAPVVSAHGYVSGVVSNGEWYSGTSPEWFYASTKPDTAGWYAENQDNGFVAPDAFADPDIICHRGATVGTGVIPVTAGETVDLQWNTWPESHHGPVITYMAAVSGEFASVAKEELNFFKIDASGLIDGTTAPGNWGSDALMANNLTSSVTIPSDIAAGNYVIRHEIIALHSAGESGGAQSYPQCINVEVTGSGTADPCADGADCAVGTALYTATDPGILVSIYQSMDSYTIPGPALYGGGESGDAPSSGNATSEAPSGNATSEAPSSMTTTAAEKTASATTQASVTAKTFCA